jgi:hypothetical protein
VFNIEAGPSNVKRLTFAISRYSGVRGRVGASTQKAGSWGEEAGDALSRCAGKLASLQMACARLSRSLQQRCLHA